MPLELKFDVKADEHGVFDGRELAQELIGTAYRLLAPYVDGCPACTDTLFTVIGNRVIDQLHQHKGEALSGGFYYMGKAEEREQGERQADNRPEIKPAPDLRHAQPGLVSVFEDAYDMNKAGTDKVSCECEGDIGRTPEAFEFYRTRGFPERGRQFQRNRFGRRIRPRAGDYRNPAIRFLDTNLDDAHVLFVAERCRLACCPRRHEAV